MLFYLKYYNLGTYLFELNYIIKDNKINEVLKQISFNRIKYLELFGLNNDIDFLSAQSLSTLV